MRARITAEKATMRFSETWARLPSERDFKAGPMGIMVATRPSMGVTRLAMRGASSRVWAYTSSSSPLRLGASRKRASRGRPPPLRRCQACRAKWPSSQKA